MKCTVLRIAQGKPTQPAVVVDLGEVEHRATYADVLQAAKIRYDETTMQLMYGRPGETFFAGHTGPESYVDDGETVGIIDISLFTPTPAGSSKLSK